MNSPRIQRALLSVSDKTGLADFARGLSAEGVELFSTGGTRRALEAEGLAVRDVAEYTGFPEMLDGRVKTLHPKIHGGILCRHDHAEDLEALGRHGILTFELVVVNLYPFEQTIAREGVSDADAIEQIDIGGPSLVRAAAKNHAFETVATCPTQYAEILAAVKSDGATTLELRRRLAGEAFAHTARYDRAIAAYFERTAGQAAAAAEPFGETLRLELRLKETLRYGENPHQRAALYADPISGGDNLISARQRNGKELSYNNLLDLDSGLAIVRMLADPAAVVIKHNNPCGAACAEALAVAARRALDGDPLSAFGSVLAFNRPLDAATAEVLIEPGRFIEAIVAPGFSPEAFDLLTTRPKWKANVRLLELSLPPGSPLRAEPPRCDYRRLAGGLLVQEADVSPDPESEWKVVTRRAPSDAELADLRFAWTLVRHVKSNAIVLAKEQMLLGVGAGQMSRVDSVQISLTKAGDKAAGAALGSDAFFPFADSIQAAAAAGVTSLIQPGGSRNDDEVIAACDEHQLAMIFTGRRHFKH